MLYVMVGIGGAVGAMLRHGLSGWAMGLLGSGFPYGTLMVNVTGSLLIGAVLQAGMERMLLSPEVRVLLTTGFCGGLTTFSTFSWETLNLLERAQWGHALLNVGLNVVVCLLAVWVGMILARAI